MNGLKNPLLSLTFEDAIESLGDVYWDVVEAADFPITKLRFRNNAILNQLDIPPKSVTDHNFEEAYGEFASRAPLLALRYHGYQFGTYNPLLGDGRGFLYGQLRDRFGQLQDLGTKGSGKTPWSRGGDGRLTLKGGVREIIASEALHKLGVKTSRTLSLVETGEDLWREDEPYPTRSAVMVRMAETHLRFGTCERLLYLQDPIHLEKLLRHVVINYYSEIANNFPIDPKFPVCTLQRQLLAFYGQLVNRVAKLVAEWMSAGFVHGVLNTDNMSLTGESFDYGPFAFINQWNPDFTAAYFDQTGLYAFGRQPSVCHNNLRLLQKPLAMLIPHKGMEELLEGFGETYKNHLSFCLTRRLGLAKHPKKLDENMTTTKTNSDYLIEKTLQLSKSWNIDYGVLFNKLTEHITKNGLPSEPEVLNTMLINLTPPPRQEWLTWRDAWWAYQNASVEVITKEKEEIPSRLKRWNILQIPTQSVIARLWSSIYEEDDWGPLNNWLESIA